MTKYSWDDSPYYTAYITRTDPTNPDETVEYEVSAKLYDHGKTEEGYDRWTGGHWVDVVEDPIFTEFVAFDEYGVELALTLKEVLACEEQMVKAYWDDYDSSMVY